MLFRRELSISERIFKGSRYQLLAVGREEIKDFIPEVPYIVISISDPDKPEQEITRSAKLRGVLSLKFHDIVQPRKFQLTTDVAMTPEHARQALSFVRQHLRDVGLIICQCEAGVSRSAGLAAALSRILEGDDEYFFLNYWPNRWVYDLLLEHGRELDPEVGGRA